MKFCCDKCAKVGDECPRLQRSQVKLSELMLMIIGSRIELNLLKVTYFLNKIHDVQTILEVDTYRGR